MKNLFVLLFLLTANGAYSQVSQKIMSEKTVVLPVDISKAKLKYTAAGYSTHLVKVIVADLASETMLNHRNVGEDGPCLFTNQTIFIDDILQGQPEIVDTEFTISLIKNARVDGDRCIIGLVEKVTANIRGFYFQHAESIELPSRVVADCM